MITLSKKFILLVCEGPYTHQAADSALLFAKALLLKGHLIEYIFFYHDGVYVASKLASPEQTERKITKNWIEFAGNNDLNLGVCSNAAMKRGMLDNLLAQQTGNSNFNFDSTFTMTGLGEFVDAVVNADRLIIFGD